MGDSVTHVPWLRTPFGKLLLCFHHESQGLNLGIACRDSAPNRQSLPLRSDPCNPRQHQTHTPATVPCLTLFLRWTLARSPLLVSNPPGLKQSFPLACQVAGTHPSAYTESTTPSPYVINEDEPKRESNERERSALPLEI